MIGYSFKLDFNVELGPDSTNLVFLLRTLSSILCSLFSTLFTPDPEPEFELDPTSSPDTFVKYDDSSKCDEFLTQSTSQLVVTTKTFSEILLQFNFFSNCLLESSFDSVTIWVTSSASGPTSDSVEQGNQKTIT